MFKYRISLDLKFKYQILVSNIEEEVLIYFFIWERGIMKYIINLNLEYGVNS